MGADKTNQHTYPSNYPPGVHWAIDEGWQILDTIKPGVISPDHRSLLCGLIAGTLMRIVEDGAPVEETKDAAP